MFYLVVAILIVSYYFFMAPRTIRSTLNMTGMVGVVALLFVLTVMSPVKIIQSPPEIFPEPVMTVLGSLTIRDVYCLSSKKGEKEHYSKRG